MKNKPTIKDIAQKADVSIATVSRVINNKPNVSHTLIQKVNNAMSELGYYPNQTAINLKRGKSDTIGLIVPDITNEFFGNISQSINLALKKRGYTTMLCDSQETIELEKEYSHILKTKQAAGLLVISSENNSNFMEKTSNEGLPVVLIDRSRSSMLNCIRVDNFKGSYYAINHLISRGYSKILGIFGPQNTLPGLERKQGFLKAVKSHENISCILETCNFNVEAGFRTVTKFLNDSLIPDSIFAGNVQIGVGAYKAISSSKLKIPEDISLIVFDDFDLAGYLNPPITTIKHPGAEIGKKAVELLMETLETDFFIPREVLVEPEIIIRKST